MKPSMMTTELPPVFVDTWGWMALADVKDPVHPAVLNLRQQYSQRSRPWVSTDFVLDETITRIFQRLPFHQAETFCTGLFRAESEGRLVMETISPERFRRAWRLRLRYRDKPRISFTDLTSFAVMQELGIRHVLTADTHFAQAGLGFRQLP